MTGGLDEPGIGVIGDFVLIEIETAHIDLALRLLIRKTVG